MPILGITASSILNSLNASSFDSIATVTVGAGGSSSISFTSIPSTYKHLQIRASFRGTKSATTQDSIIRYNNDTTSGDYVFFHQLYGDGASASANSDVLSASSSLFTFAPGSTALSNTFNAGVADILDYTNTNKYKTLRSLSGFDVNGSGGYVVFRSGLWMKTDAINRIDILGLSDGFAQYSTFALYGIKGA